MPGGITGFFIRLGNIINSPVNVGISTGGAEPHTQLGRIEPGNDAHHHEDTDADAHHGDHAPLLVHDDHHHGADDDHTHDYDDDHHHHG